MKISEIAALCPDFHLGFKPRHGWGWKADQNKGAIDYEIIDKAGQFSLIINGAFQWEGHYRGFYGMISEKDHILFGYRFVLWSMCGNDPELETSIDSRWDLYFSQQEFQSDFIDFVDSESAGVGYGSPILK